MRTILITKKSLRTLRTLTVGVAVLALLVGMTACGSTASNDPAGPGTKIKVVAAENFWGSIASQIGGDRVQEVNIITKPNADPHDYEATSGDSATIAQAQLMIVNGLGYDPWATKAIDASPSSSRQVINVGDLVGLKDGDNPHRWYSPNNVDQVINAITDKLKALSPSDSSYFESQRSDFITNKLAKYDNLRTSITQRFAGTPVAATESIFVPLAADLKLNLITPEALLNAVSEGDDPTVGDKTTADQQIDTKAAKILVFNKQNSTPDVQAMVDKANAQGIPVVAVTETPDPFDTSFQDWQTAQLQALSDALARGRADR